MKRKLLSFCFTVLLGLVMVQAASAATIGTASSTGWSGTYAGVYSYGTNQWLEEDNQLGTANASSEVDYDPGTGDLYGYSHVEPYYFNGYNVVQGDYGVMHTGGYFRDEIYFQTSDNLPGSMKFQFHISFYLEVNADTASQSRFNMTLMSPNPVPGEPPYILAGFDQNMISDGSGNVTLNGESHGNSLYFDDIVTLDTNANGDLLASGMFIPLSFTLWTDVNEGVADWYHTVELEDVQVYDEAGNLLDPSQYTLLSNSEKFSDFNNQMSDVPLPGAALLLGSGLLQLAIYSRRRKSAASS